MIGDLFEEWAKGLNRGFRIKATKILVLVNNFSAKLTTERVNKVT